MSFHRKPSQFEIEQSILLAQKAARDHPEFQEWSMLDPDMAFIIWFLEHPNASLIEILTTSGKLEFLKGTTEITKLGFIVGSETISANVSKEITRLRESVSHP